MVNLNFYVPLYLFFFQLQHKRHKNIHLYYCPPYKHLQFFTHNTHIFYHYIMSSVGSAREGTCAQCSRSRARMQSALTLVQKLCAQCSLCAHFCAHFSEILAGAQPVLMSTSTKIALKSEHALTFECILAEHECKNALKNEHQCEHLSTSTE